MNTNEPPVISTHELTKRYGKKVALDGLSIELRRGRIYGLVGNNGSGKTTLLRILTGLSPRYEGKVEILGRDDKKGLRLSRRSLGALVDAPAYYDDLSVKDNLVLRSILLGKKDKARVEELREQFGLTDREVGTRAIHFCSLGQKQRFGIAATLLGEPRVLLLDEPINGLDPSGVAETRELLRKINEESGVTMLISSHLLAELYKLATDFIFIDRGRLLEQISSEELDARIAERGMEDVEEYFIALVRASEGRG